MNHTSEGHRAPLATVEARFGARLAASLNERAATVPHDISERLRFSREQALSRVRPAATTVTSPVIAGFSSRAAAVLGNPGGLWLQLAAWMPLAVLVAGLVLIQEWTTREQVLAAAEIDAVLLADDLPPTAWADPGFREFLKAPTP